jgi:hypothetical protein
MPLKRALSAVLCGAVIAGLPGVKGDIPASPLTGATEEPAGD